MDKSYLMQDPAVRLYLNRVRNEIFDATVHTKVIDEVSAKIQTLTEKYIDLGQNEKEAIRSALTENGKASKVGIRYNKIYKIPYYKGKFILRLLMNFMGMLIGFVLMIVFGTFYVIPFPHMLFLLSAIAGLSAWYGFRRHMKPIHMVINLFALPGFILITVIQSIIFKYNAYLRHFVFGQPSSPFVIEFGLYEMQFITAMILIFVGVLVILWIHADNYMETGKAKIVRGVLVILLACGFILTYGSDMRIREYRELKANEYFVKYWAALKDSSASVDNYDPAGTPVDFSVYAPLADIDGVIESYIKTYGKPINYNMAVSSATYLKNVQNFLNGTSKNIKGLTGKSSDIPVDQRKSAVKEFFNKLESSRLKISDYKRENSGGLMTINTEIQAAYADFIASIR